MWWLADLLRLGDLLLKGATPELPLSPKSCAGCIYDTPRFRLRHSRRPGWTMVKKTAAFRQRRAADTARWRERLHRGAAVYPVEVDGTTFDLMERFGGLKDSKTGDRQAIATALGKLLRRALEFPIHPHMLRHGCGYALA